MDASIADILKGKPLADQTTPGHPKFVGPPEDTSGWVSDLFAGIIGGMSGLPPKEMDPKRLKSMQLQRGVANATQEQVAQAAQQMAQIIGYANIKSGEMRQRSARGRARGASSRSGRG